MSRLPNGKANAGRLVGDYNNPILTPEAAAIVKQKGELASAGGLSQFAGSVPRHRAAFHFAMQLGLAMLPLKNGEHLIAQRQQRQYPPHPHERHASGRI